MKKVIVWALFLRICCITFSAGAAEQPPVDPSYRSNSSQPVKAGQPFPREKSYRDMDELFMLYQPYIGNVSAYEPIYFLAGTDPQYSKFQISLKYRIFNLQGTWSRSHPWLQGFHLAYTQTSYWDLKAASKPFEDTGYKPGFFFRSANLGWFDRKSVSLFLQTGYQHESNGQAGDRSREINIYYVRPIAIWYNDTSKLGCLVSPRVWYYLSRENDGIEDYRGYFDLKMIVGKGDSLVGSADLRWAAEGPSIQLDLTYPLREILFENLDLYLQVQYTNSLAESLLHFWERTNALRIGIAIIR